MKNNKGFISVSIVYSFFIVFIAIIIGMVAMYVNRRILINALEDKIRESFPTGCSAEGITELSECILFNNGGREYIESQESPDFSVETSAGEYGLYSSQDDLGTSYYFRGDVVNNYVQFGSYAANSTVNGTTYRAETPMYWRIVRINGDGTIRLVYDGTSKVQNGTMHIATISDSAYNLTEYRNVNYGDSDIKGIVDAWYNTYIKSEYGSYIADGIFCNDKEVTSEKYYILDDENRIAIETTKDNAQYIEAEYAPHTRLYTNKSPKLTCSRTEDKYTTNARIGNGLLTHPVGLLTADEMVYAGGVYDKINAAYYLFTGDNFWTSSPNDSSRYGDPSSMWHMSYEASLAISNVTGSFGARPVINLRADVGFTGIGTIDDPYVVGE